MAGQKRDTGTKPDDPEQSKRFVEMAKEAGAEAEGPILDKMPRKVAATPRNKAFKSIAAAAFPHIRQESRNRRLF